MSTDSQQYDSRIGPPDEDSRNDLEADRHLRDQGARRSSESARDSHVRQARRVAARTQPARSRMLWLVAAGLLLAGALVFWKMRPAPAKLQGLPDLTAQTDAGPEGLAAVDAPLAASASAPKTFVATLQDVYGEVKAGVASVKSLLDGQREQQATLARLEHDVDQIAASVAKLEQTQQAAAAQAARTPVRRVAKAAARPQAAAPLSQERQAQLLAVDIWDGKPSVVVGTSDPADRVRFLREGDQQAGVTLKQADARGQRAVFDVAGHDVELARDRSN